MVDVAIAGGGLSGCLAALALTRRRPDLKILLIERELDLGGQHVWSFFDSDVGPEARWVLEGLPVTRWPTHEVRFPARHRILNIGYNSLSSEGLNETVRRRLKPDQMLFGKAIDRLETDAVYLEGGERVAASAVVDARGPRPMPGWSWPGRSSSGTFTASTRGTAMNGPSSWMRRSIRRMATASSIRFRSAPKT